MNFKSAEKWVSKNLMGNEFLLIFLMILVVIVIIDCNTKMFSKMLEGNSPINKTGNVSVTGTCGRDNSLPQKNPTTDAKKSCKFNPADVKGQNKFNVTGYEDLEEFHTLYASVEKPLGPTIPRSMQQDFTVLKSFGLTKMPDVINYIPGPGPQEFQKVTPKSVTKDAPGKPGKKEVHVKMYYASWCGHSNKAKPHFEKVIKEHNNTKMDDVHVKASIVHHDSPEAKKENIKGFPTYMAHISKDGKEVSKYVLNLADRSTESIKKATVDAVQKAQNM